MNTIKPSMIRQSALDHFIGKDNSYFQFIGKYPESPLYARYKSLEDYLSGAERINHLPRSLTIKLFERTLTKVEEIRVGDKKEV